MAREPGGAGIAGKGDLHGGGLAGEDQQAVAGHVQRQVHQDVDAVLADASGDLLVGQAHDVAPDARHSPGSGR